MQLLDLQGCKLGLGGKRFYPAVMHLSVASLIEKTISITQETAWSILTVYSFSVNGTHIENGLLLYVPEASHHHQVPLDLPAIISANKALVNFPNRGLWNPKYMYKNIYII